LARGFGVSGFFREAEYLVDEACFQYLGVRIAGSGFMRRLQEIDRLARRDQQALLRTIDRFPESFRQAERARAMKLWRRTKAPQAVELFDQIIGQTSTAPLSELLTSLSMLAREIRDANLQQWADLELGGYLREDPAMTESIVVPEYRGVPGQWRDDYGRPLVIKDPELHFVNETRLRHGVAELERLSQTKDVLTSQDAHLADLIHKHLHVEVTWYQFSPGAIVGILAAIRARLVDRLYKVRPVVEQIRSNDQRRPDLARLVDASQLTDPKVLHDHIIRIEKSIKDDPAQAIGSAKELVETAAKHVLKQCGDDPDAYDKFARLVKTAVARLDLASETIPDPQKGAQALAMLTSGLGQIAEATATLRNLYGTGHGRIRPSGADARHARLVVGACSALAAFLLETLVSRKTP
jgi:hypothetical protein